jgi:hypothetical protein
MMTIRSGVMSQVHDGDEVSEPYRLNGLINEYEQAA